MKKIYFACLSPNGTTDMNGRYCEYQWSESSEADYGEEWDGDVRAYLENALEDPSVLDNEYTGAIHNLPENAIVIADEDGTPREIWWAE